MARKKKRAKKPVRPAPKKRSAKRVTPKLAKKRAAPAKKIAKPVAKRAPHKKAAAAKTVVPVDVRPARGHHDMGGLPAGKIVASEHDYALWEKRVDAMLVLLSDKKRGLMNTDMLRRGIESLPPDAYDRMSYYERWIHSVTTMILERGIITRAELDARIAKLRAQAA